jgi:hypothetical protein
VACELTASDPSQGGTFVRRLLSVLSLVLGIIGFPSASFALLQPLCPTSYLTCTGGAPNVVGNSGTGLSYPEIVPIFWSSSSYSWTPARQAPIIGSLQYIVNGPYMGQLNQYGGSGAGVGPARMTPMAPVYTGTMPALVSASNITATINALINAGRVPAPGADLDLLYVVFLPPNTATNPAAGGYNYGGANGSTPYNAAFVIGNNPAALSHEIVESTAGNMAVTNCTYTGSSNIANQIGDICGCYVDNTQEVPLAAYWSVADNACVVPTGWQHVLQYSGGTSWTTIGSNVRQVYAGEDGGGSCLTPPCLIATDMSDNLLQYNQSPGSWSTIGGPGAMFSVGGSEVLGMTPDGTAVYRYHGGTWTLIDNYPTSVSSGLFHLITDYTGSPYQYMPSTNTMVNIGGPGDQFVVGSNWAAALGVNHDYVAIAGSGGPWYLTGSGSGAELFIGGGQAVAKRDLDSGRTISAMTTTCTGGGGTTSCTFNPWKNSIGGSGNTFAIYGGADASTTLLAGLTPNRAAVWQDDNPIEASSTNWQQIGGSFTRIIGHGTFLYATSGILF